MNVLCLKLRNRHAVWNPTAASASYSEDGQTYSIPTDGQNADKIRRLADSAKEYSCKMSPPLPVTEDTPPDMLAGAMDLHVVLPNGQDMKMSVERSTPMMDLLVQVTTANKISPGGHVIQAIGDRGVLPYKPSTPIGALDTWTIHIVPKKKAGNMILKKPFTKPVSNTPFEQTFRLQVNLPRNQLYVSRVSYKTRLGDVLTEVCKEKNLDQSKYRFTHPDKLDEELDLTKSFLDHKLQQVTLVSKSSRPVGLSSVDVIELKRYDNRNHNVNNKYYASHSYDGSVSSGSMEGRSLSPVRSDESSSSPTIPKTNSILNRPFRKRRPAPKPPSLQNGKETKHVPDSLTISHSRNSSDSSGYHESSVLSESPESNSNSLADSLPRRSKLTENPSNAKISQPVPNCSGKIGGNLSRSLSNLAVTADGKSRTFLSNGMRPKEYSASSMSLASIPGRKKKAPAPPPPSSKSLLSLKEEEIPNGHVTPTIPEDVVLKSQTLPATNKLTTFTTIESNCSKIQSQRPQLPESQPPRNCSVDNRRSIQSTQPLDEVDSNTKSTLHPDVPQPDTNVKDKELTMDDEEIDRIFHDATKDYETPSLPVLPSPPKLANDDQNDKGNGMNEDPYNWEYKLPSPPKAFRDQTSSPSVTEYDTVTIGNLTDVINEKRLPNATHKPDVMLNNYKNTLYNQEREIHPPAAQSTHPDIPDPTPIVPTVKEKNTQSFYDDSIKRATSASKDNCDKTPYIDVNYMTTNDSGLGSDESIPSVSEGKSSVDDQPYTKAIRTPERRGSTLQNFTITTYQNTKPTEIFHDDSVKTAKTTQMAKNKHPYVKLPFEKKPEKSNGLSRHSSFNTEKTPNAAVKRSKSHISLLSGNFAKFNRFGKLNIKEDEHSGHTSPMYSSSENIQMVESAPKPQSFPVQRLRKTLSEISINKDNNRGEEELLELQDQFMKWKENEKRSNALNKMRNVTELQSLQVLKDILPQINKPQVQDVQIANPKNTIEENYPSRARCFKNDPKPKPSLDHAPAVNLQSWSDRPKRQVSIKTDRDYVFGNIRRQTEKFETQYQNSASSKSTSDALKSSSTEPTDISHVPIVRAVEFKKPFVQQSKLETPHYPVPENKIQKLPKVRVETKPRPASCYIFGEHLSNGVNRSQSMSVNKNHANVQEPDKLNGNHVNGREENDSIIQCNRVSKTKIMFNSSVPYNNKYKSVTEINEDTTKRHSIHNGFATELSNRVNEYTFKTYKNKLIENDKSNPTNEIKSTKCDDIKSAKTNGEKSPEKKSIFRIFRKEGSPPEVVTTRSVGIPPPPPVMPTLKPVNQKFNCHKQCSENPRDVLLSSIKNFNRDNLRNVRIK